MAANTSIIQIINYIDEALLIEHGIKKTDCTIMKGNEKSVNVFNYDENGFCSMYTNTSYRNNKIVSTSHLTFVNDKYGNPISTHVSTPLDGANPLPIVVCDYAYDDGKLTTSIQRIRDEETDTWSSIKEVVDYNEDGSLADISLYTVDSDGYYDIWILVDVADYEDGNITKMAIKTDETEYFVDITWLDNILHSITIKYLEPEAGEEVLEMNFNPVRFFGSANSEAIETIFEVYGFRVSSGYIMNKKKEAEDEK